MRAAILYCADEAYRLPLAASLRGLAGVLSEPADVAVVDAGLSAETRRRLALCLDPGWNLSFHPLPDAWTAGLPDPGRFSNAAYGRLFASRFAAGAGRLLYLDSDTLPVRPLDSLFEMDMEGATVAAVRDEYVRSFGSAEGPSRRYPGLAPDLPYFNSGVLLIDVARWRRARITEASIDWLRGEVGAIEYVDQDALNIVLRRQWKALDARWNVGRYWYRPERRTGPFASIAKEARILHYTTEYKPWLAPATVPDWAREPFFRALDQTPWRGWRPGDEAASANGACERGSGAAAAGPRTA